MTCRCLEGMRYQSSISVLGHKHLLHNDSCRRSFSRLDLAARLSTLSKDWILEQALHDRSGVKLPYGILQETMLAKHIAPTSKKSAFGNCGLQFRTEMVHHGLGRNILQA